MESGDEILLSLLSAIFLILCVLSGGTQLRALSCYQSKKLLLNHHQNHVYKQTLPNYQKTATTTTTTKNY